MPQEAGVPPHNLEAEEAVLGAILFSREAIADVLEILQPQDFYRPAHQRIFEAVVELYAQGEPADVVTVAESLRRKGVLDDVGGLPYVHTLVSAVPSPSNAAHYARIVKETAVLRRLGEAGARISQLAYSPPGDLEETLDRAEQLLYGVLEKRTMEDFHPLRALLTENLEAIERLSARKSRVTGISTGFPELDSLTSGLQPSNLIIVAARPGAGKTSFVLNLARHVGVEEGIPVAVFSLEMSRHEVVQRLICSEARVDSHRLRTGRLNEEDWPRISHAAGRLAEAPIFVDDTPNISVMEIRAKARRLKHKEGLGLVVVDYLQLMRSHGRVENRQQEVAEISRALKILARELDIPVVAASQLSRNVEYRAEKKPVLADLRDSGSIEQDADLVIFIYREAMYNPDIPDPGRTEIIVAKHRNGPTGTVELAFLQPYTQFASLARV